MRAFTLACLVAVTAFAGDNTQTSVKMIKADHLEDILDDSDLATAIQKKLGSGAKPVAIVEEETVMLAPKKKTSLFDIFDESDSDDEWDLELSGDDFFGDRKPSKPSGPRKPERPSGPTALNNMAKTGRVLNQVSAGFEDIKEVNAEIEEQIIERIQQDQEIEVQQVLQEAIEEAQDVIVNNSLPPQIAVQVVEEIYEEKQEIIAEINDAKDDIIAEVSKSAAIAEVKNDKIEEELVEEIFEAIEESVDIAEVIEEAELPFPVDADVKSQDKDIPQQAAETLDRIVCRNGVCKELIENDPEFPRFIAEMAEGSGIETPKPQQVTNYDDGVWDAPKRLINFASGPQAPQGLPQGMMY